MDRLELMDFIAKVQEIKEKDTNKFYELKGFLKALAYLNNNARNS